MQTSALIAIVDDDQSFRVAMESLVRSLGHKAQGFASAEAFLASDICASTDCIISDIQMPGMSGIEMARQLSAEECSTPVIMVTARTEETLRDQALGTGAICLLHKPFDAARVEACLQLALNP